MERLLQIFVSLLCLLLVSAPALASGTDVADGKKSNHWRDTELREAGSAVFRWWGFHVYEAKLFVNSAVLEDGYNAVSARPKVLTLTYNTSFTAEEFFVSSTEILAANDRIRPSIAKQCLSELQSIFRPVTKGDSYQLVHRKDGKLDLLLNDELLGTVCDENGTRAYFSIWLSRDHSIKESFQRELLGAAATTSQFMEDTP